MLGTHAEKQAEQSLRDAKAEERVLKELRERIDSEELKQKKRMELFDNTHKRLQGLDKSLRGKDYENFCYEYEKFKNSYEELKKLKEETIPADIEQCEAKRQQAEDSIAACNESFSKAEVALVAIAAAVTGVLPFLAIACAAWKILGETYNFISDKHYQKKADEKAQAEEYNKVIAKHGAKIFGDTPPENFKTIDSSKLDERAKALQQFYKACDPYKIPKYNKEAAAFNIGLALDELDPSDREDIINGIKARELIEETSGESFGVEHDTLKTAAAQSLIRSGDLSGAKEVTSVSEPLINNSLGSDHNQGGVAKLKSLIDKEIGQGPAADAEKLVKNGIVNVTDLPNLHVLRDSIYLDADADSGSKKDSDSDAGSKSKKGFVAALITAVNYKAQVDNVVASLREHKAKLIELRHPSFINNGVKIKDIEAKEKAIEKQIKELNKYKDLDGGGDITKANQLIDDAQQILENNKKEQNGRNLKETRADTNTSAVVSNAPSSSGL